MKTLLERREAARDGRNVDPGLGTLAGEGAEQRVRRLDAGHSERRVMAPPEPELEGRPSYYGMPLLKEPVWKWFIPAYFYVGGVSGASAVLGAASDLLGPRGTRALSRRCRLTAAAGAGASAALLIADLGRPARFLNMLRVFRPTSPMNVGTWILSGFGAATAAAAGAALLPVGPGARRAGDAAAAVAGLCGLGLTGYTGVLIANTAVPLWQGTRRALPVLFSCSGAAAATALLELFPPGDRSEPVVRRFGVLANVSELVMTGVLEAEAGVVPRVARPLRTGISGALWRAGQALSLASLALTLGSRGRRSLRRAAGLCGTAGSLALRFAIYQAGRRSALDPHASFEQQRRGRGAADVVRAQPGLDRALGEKGAEPPATPTLHDPGLAHP
ncbi:NrfD/PsrC family molybdoenzyme membrane anchor subunit [Anaeromyxobacter paludicola]|uniref:Polysulfide reductase n=1 Tax=Anaeromyxobacter paludicola TaxID=2918171 RepID=A0ABM7XFD9_9BACT|nr:NrfD/PsrC family molybdoenzyme membrane anchor subunit [Anaeromyxobacter paludicola]BDG10542.1 polysulfide reductase [Anaeromyxobacter paludicola]